MRNCPLLSMIIISQALSYASPHATVGNSLKLDGAQRQHVCSVINVNLVFLKRLPNPEQEILWAVTGIVPARRCPRSAV